MKKIAIAFLILGSNLSFGQAETLFFEQIAFDLYKDTILEKYPSEKKIRIPKYAVDFHSNYDWFQVDKCLTGEFLDGRTNLKILTSYTVKQSDFDFYNKLMNYEGLDKKRFRIKNSKTESYPYLRISMPYHKLNEDNRYILKISEHHKKWNIDYFVLIDQNGEIIDWCRNKYSNLTQYD